MQIDLYCGIYIVRLATQRNILFVSKAAREGKEWMKEKKIDETVDLYYCTKVQRVPPAFQQMTLFPQLGAVEISTA